MDLEVRITGRGIVRGDSVIADATVDAQCGMCGNAVEAVVSIGSKDGTTAMYICPSCLRTRLDALSVGRYRLREPGAGLPWGKVAG
jgi:hypothetical protein